MNKEIDSIEIFEQIITDFVNANINSNKEFDFINIKNSYHKLLFKYHPDIIEEKDKTKNNMNTIAGEYKIERLIDLFKKAQKIASNKNNIKRIDPDNSILSKSSMLVSRETLNSIVIGGLIRLLVEGYFLNSVSDVHNKTSYQILEIVKEYKERVNSTCDVDKNTVSESIKLFVEVVSVLIIVGGEVINKVNDFTKIDPIKVMSFVDSRMQKYFNELIKKSREGYFVFREFVFFSGESFIIELGEYANQLKIEQIGLGKTYNSLFLYVYTNIVIIKIIQEEVLFEEIFKGIREF